MENLMGAILKVAAASGNTIDFESVVEKINTVKEEIGGIANNILQSNTESMQETGK